SHRLERVSDGLLYGHLDNFSGVYAVMKAYFSGRLNQDYLRIELTYGEEVDMAGAKQVLETLAPEDVVAVVDVTGTSTDKDFVIEKCRRDALREFLGKALCSLSFDIYADCPDPVSTHDEADVYFQKCENVFFLGIPITGGDYNAGPVFCRERSIDALSEAICIIAEQFPELCRACGLPQP
ncbi:MAG: hypothetical protein ACP5R4_02210, partial [Armatimonadota bacterium]